MVRGMQQVDDNGFFKMLSLVKHFTAYSRETDRFHGSYNISTFDLFDTYLRQFETVFGPEGRASGAMCSYVTCCA